jgi:hypothetical protein
MLSEVATGGRLLTAEQRAKLTADVIITKTNVSATDATKRPKGWAELRLKRVMFREHIDRIAGIDEENIMDMHADREILVGSLCSVCCVYSVCHVDCVCYDN